MTTDYRNYSKLPEFHNLNHYEWTGSATLVTMYHNGKPMYDIVRPLDNPLVEPDFFLNTIVAEQYQLLINGIELLPCPFCGSRCVQLYRGSSFAPVWWGVCWNCGASADTGSWDWDDVDFDNGPEVLAAELKGKQLAALKWNRRPAPTIQPVVVHEDTNECKECAGSGSCSPCGGDGTVITSAQVEVRCMVCLGSGRCAYCTGTGKLA